MIYTTKSYNIGLCSKNMWKWKGVVPMRYRDKLESFKGKSFGENSVLIDDTLLILDDIEGEVSSIIESLKIGNNISALDELEELLERLY